MTHGFPEAAQRELDRLEEICWSEQTASAPSPSGGRGETVLRRFSSKRDELRFRRKVKNLAHVRSAEEPEIVDLVLALALACQRHASVQRDLGRHRAAEKNLKRSIRIGQKHGSAFVQFHGWHSLGSGRYLAGEYHSAVGCFQKAIYFATFAWPSSLESCLRYLAWCYERVEPRVSVACYNVLLASPTTDTYSAMEDMYRFLVRLGKREKVKKTAMRDAASIVQIAHKTAALCALRRYKAAVASAERGCRMADENGDAGWRDLFQNVLQRSTKLT
jgi:hypothetical protein